MHSYPLHLSSVNHSGGLLNPKGGIVGTPELVLGWPKVWWPGDTMCGWHLRGGSLTGVSPLTPQDLILPPGGYNQTSVTGDPGGIRKNRESTKLKCPKWDSGSCPPSILLLGGPLPQGLRPLLVTAPVQILKAPPSLPLLPYGSISMLC